MVVLAIHGGAGGDGPWGGPTDLDPARIECMQSILANVGKALEEGKITALEAVTEAVSLLEDEPLFNAGRGAVIGADGKITMDASIMNGKDCSAGACAGVSNLRHPIRLANHLLKGNWPLMLFGKGADEAGRKAGLEVVSQEWLATPLRWAQWKKWRDSNLRPGATDEDDNVLNAVLDHDIEIGPISEFSHENLLEEIDGPGTVGAVALDKEGNLAAATSTGGMTGKPLGRVGDTPLIGAGTWADSRVAISNTGIGEAYIRTCAAKRVADLVELANMDLETACNMMLDEVEPFGGRGGIIAISSKGEVCMPFQVTLMYRGTYIEGGVFTAIGPN